MVLTVVVGSSGSGKTTFLNDTVKSHKCTYIKQYHNIRPYVTVKKIPNFDPTKLPYWSIYEKEGTADSMKVGGTMAGEFTAGLSGGQRKVMMFELICQRAEGQSDLLLVLDEPFAGVTDDFVPYIIERLGHLRESHNILLVTNDHIKKLKELADNTITVSAIDRSVVKVNGNHTVDREKAILGLSVGKNYAYSASSADTRFFLDVEILASKQLLSIAVYTVVAYSTFIATFWDSHEENAALVYVGSFLVMYFCVNPFLLTLEDWRNFMTEEAEALVHASRKKTKLLMSLLTLFLILAVTVIEWVAVNIVVDGFEDVRFLLAMLMDSFSMTIPFVYLGIYSKFPFTLVQIFSTLPFLFMLFFSTTFSPGAGVNGLKVLRFLFSRFYLWCMIPSTQDMMEGCPDDEGENLWYLCLSAFLGTFMFFFYQFVAMVLRRTAKKEEAKKKDSMKDDAFIDLQVELYGKEGFTRDSLAGTTRSQTARRDTADSDSSNEENMSTVEA
eukprot:Nitzschia sp. Nitz4//scaffold250_size28497//13872//15478//NITZ4_008125-RA/size28497-processed-gene-0.18-mRNA-1//-1//CDS//3329544216//3044//frame0